MNKKKAAHSRSLFFCFFTIPYETGDHSPQRRKHASKPQACHVPKIWDTLAARSVPLVEVLSL